MNHQCSSFRRFFVLAFADDVSFNSTNQSIMLSLQLGNSLYNGSLLFFHFFVCSFFYNLFVGFWKRKIIFIHLIFHNFFVFTVAFLTLFILSVENMTNFFHYAEISYRLTFNALQCECETVCKCQKMNSNQRDSIFYPLFQSQST